MKSKLGFYNKTEAGRIYSLVVLLLLLVAFCLVPAIAQADITPGEQTILTWSENPAGSQTITWLSPNSDANKLQYITAAGFDGDFAAATEIVAAGGPFAAGEQYRFSVVLKNLVPATQYFYRVGSDENWGGIKSFQTAGGENGFSFLYMGDVQEGYSAWGNMLENIYNGNPQIRFALLAGDLTTEGRNCAEWSEFLQAATGVFSRIPMMSAKGNHDKELFCEFLVFPKNGPPGLNEIFYSFDYGDAHFTVLDTSNVITASVKQWLRNDLQNTDKKWKLVLFHHPPYQNFDDDKTVDDALREHWVPILEDNQVDMVFVGHQHVYMRTHPLYQGEIMNNSYGIVYVMGNSGSKEYNPGPGFPYIAKQEAGSNYQVVELEGDVLTLTSRHGDGRLIETYVLDKSCSEKQYAYYRVAADGDNTAYIPGLTPEGICSLTIRSGVSGYKDFGVTVTSLLAHPGKETVVFSQIRDGKHLQINSTRADFDEVNHAHAGFNVTGGDVINIYIVDELTNAIDHNPIILQN